jgi:DNA repair protein RadA/Sms
MRQPKAKKLAKHLARFSNPIAFAASVYGAFLLRFDFRISDAYVPMMVTGIGIAVCVKYLVFTLAGPRILEHMVDTVIYFEGERHHAYRILRAVKNRFGATHEIGVFEMASTGLQQVANPSEAFLQTRDDRAPGSVVTCCLEGSRPLLLEVQALVGRTNYAMPQRVSMGFDQKRLTLLLAILEKFAGLEIGPQDVFVNLAGGFRVDEPAIDLAVAAAVAGNHLGKRSRPGTLALGELGLNGELRPVPQLEARLREARRLGFTRAIVPETQKSPPRIQGLELFTAKRVRDAFEGLFE